MAEVGRDQVTISGTSGRWRSTPMVPPGITSFPLTSHSVTQLVPAFRSCYYYKAVQFGSYRIVRLSLWSLQQLSFLIFQELQTSSLQFIMSLYAVMQLDKHVDFTTLCDCCFLSKCEWFLSAPLQHMWNMLNCTYTLHAYYELSCNSYTVIYMWH